MSRNVRKWIVFSIWQRVVFWYILIYPKISKKKFIRHNNNHDIIIMDIILVVVPATKQEVLCLPWYLFAYWQSANNVDNYIILINLFGILYQTIAAFCVWCSFLCQFPRTRIPSSLRWRDREAGLPEAVTDAAPSHAMVLAPSQTGLQSYLFAFFFLLIIAINLIILKSSRKSACQLLSLGGSTWW